MAFHYDPAFLVWRGQFAYPIRKEGLFLAWLLMGQQKMALTKEESKRKKAEEHFFAKVHFYAVFHASKALFSCLVALSSSFSKFLSQFFSQAFKAMGKFLHQINAVLVFSFLDQYAKNSNLLNVCFNDKYPKQNTPFLNCSGSETGVKNGLAFCLGPPIERKPPASFILCSKSP